MGYAVGVFHPGNGHTDPAPYNLTPAELGALALDGYPVTLEHAGIDKAAALLASLGVTETATAVRIALAATAPDAYRKEVGTVVATAKAADGRWLCLLSLKDLPAITNMVKIGALRGLSLTHLVGTPPIPLEVSLCCQPARDGCYIECLVSNLEVAQQYMRDAITAPRRMSDTSMTDATAPTGLTEIIESLPDTHRATLKAAVSGMVQQIQAARDTAKMSSGAADAAKSRNELLTQQIQTMTKLINPDIAKSYLCTEDEILKDMNSGNMQRVLDRTERMLACCTRHMMDMAANSSSRKRPREDEPAAPAAQSTEDIDMPAAVPVDDVSRGLAGAFGFDI